MERQLQQFTVQEILIPLLTETQLLSLSRCSTITNKICNEWIKKIATPDSCKIFECCRDNKIISLGLLIKKYGDTLDWDKGLYGACQGGCRELMELMIEKGATRWETGMAYASQGGHRELVELIIGKIKGEINWDFVMAYACWGGNKDIVELLIEKGATKWDLGMVMACRGGYRDLVELMIEKGATDWNWGLGMACNGGYRVNLVELMIEKGATQCSCGRSINDHLRGQ